MRSSPWTAPAVTVGFLVFTLAGYALPARASEFHVSPAGSDANPGTKDRPFATLPRARDAVREVRRGGWPREGVTVYLHAGEYRLAGTLVLTPADSGEPGRPVVWRAAAGEQAVISGGREIIGWKRLEGDLPGLLAAAKGKVFVAEVPKGWWFHALYVDGRRQQVARQVNSSDRGRWPVLAGMGKTGPDGIAIKFPPKMAVPRCESLEMDFLAAAWWNCLPVIRHVDSEKGTGQLHSRDPLFFRPGGLKYGGGPFNLQNAVEFLDEPGEWCVDTKRGSVYYWPVEGTMTGRRVVAPALSQLVRLQGDDLAPMDDTWRVKYDAAGGPFGRLVRHVEFRGLSFAYADRLPEDAWPVWWLKRQSENPEGMIVLEGQKGCAIDSCRLLHGGGYAVSLWHWAQDNRIEGCQMGDLSSGAVNLSGYGPGKVDVNGGNRIARNYIHDVGLEYMHAPAVQVYGSRGNRIEGNAVFRMPYAGVSIVGVLPDELTASDCEYGDAYGDFRAQYQVRRHEIPDRKAISYALAKSLLHSGDNVVAGNLFVDFMIWLNDGGCLYSWSAGAGTRWDRNLCVRSARLANREVFILYMDDKSDGHTLSHNVSWSSGAPVMSKGENTLTGNVASFPQKPAGYDERLAEIRRAVAAQGGWPEAVKAETIPGDTK